MYFLTHYVTIWIIIFPITIQELRNNGTVKLVKIYSLLVQFRQKTTSVVFDRIGREVNFTGKMDK